MNAQELMPKDKFDLDAAKRLSLATPEQVSSIAIPILEWIADMNWPVALELIHVLPKFHEELLPSIEKILVNPQNDIIWKYWIISQLLSQFPKKSLLTILSIIQDYATLIPHNEDEKDLRKASIDFLTWYKEANYYEIRT